MKLQIDYLGGPRLIAETQRWECRVRIQIGSVPFYVAGEGSTLEDAERAIERAVAEMIEVNDKYSRIARTGKFNWEKAGE